MKTIFNDFWYYERKANMNYIFIAVFLSGMVFNLGMRLRAANRQIGILKDRKDFLEASRSACTHVWLMDESASKQLENSGMILLKMK